MKRILTFLACISSICLISCPSAKSQTAIRSINNCDKSVISLTAKSVAYMIKEKYSFDLLLYTEECSYCEKARTNISKIANNTNYCFYQIEMFEGARDYLIKELPDYFSIEDTYPSLYIFDKGKITYKSNYKDLQEYTNFKKLVNAQNIETNIYTLNDLEVYNKFDSAKGSYLLYTHSSDSENGNNYYSDYLFDVASKSSKNTLIIDKYTAKTDLISKIYQKHNIDSDETFSFLSIVENGQIKTTLHYNEQSGQNFNDLVLFFFNLDSINRSR